MLVKADRTATNSCNIDIDGTMLFETTQVELTDHQKVIIFVYETPESVYITV